jgi:hypothetical protein
MKRFKRLIKLINDPKGKATAEKEASKNPYEYIKKHKNEDIRKLKGIAF